MQPQITVRPAVQSDYDAVARITRDSYLAAGYFDDAGHPYMRKIQEVALRADQATIWVAEREGTVVGSVTLAVAGEPYADIAQHDSDDAQGDHESGLASQHGHEVAHELA